MDRCVCGNKIYSTANFKDLGECFYCYRLYRFKSNKWIRVNREDFKSLYKVKMINQQRFKNWELE